MTLVEPAGTAAAHPEPELLDALVDGEIADPGLREALDGHLARCAPCAAAARSTLDLKRLLRGLPLHEPAAPLVAAVAVHPADDLLDAVLDGELDPIDDAALRHHLDACEPCAGALASLASIRSVVRGLPSVAAPAGLRPEPAIHPGESLSAALDGELDPVATEAIESHLDACPACANEAADVDAARSVVRSLPSRTPTRPLQTPAPTPPRPGRSRPGGRGPGGRGPGRRRSRRMVAVAAVAGFAGVFGLALRPTSSADPARPGVATFVSEHSQNAPSPDAMGGLAPVGVPVTFGP